jgi:hypothetical protein
VEALELVKLLVWLVLLKVGRLTHLRLRRSSGRM